MPLARATSRAEEQLQALLNPEVLNLLPNREASPNGPRLARCCNATRDVYRHAVSAGVA